MWTQVLLAVYGHMGESQPENWWKLLVSDVPYKHSSVMRENGGAPTHLSNTNFNALGFPAAIATLIGLQPDVT